VKPFLSQAFFWILFSLFFSGCATRTKVEPCDLSYVAACSSYYADESSFQACLTEMGGAACSLSTEDIEAINASLGEDITSYTCSSVNPRVHEISDAGHSVTHTPTPGETVYYVDAFHSPLADYQNFVVTYTITAAIEMANAGDTIVVCPGDYPENLLISGDNKDDLKILNIAGGSLEFAPYTQIVGEFGSSLVVSGVQGLQIKGLTLKQGNSGLLAGNGFGGGVLISSFRAMDDVNDRIVIQNSFITDNTALYDGGGIFVEGLVDVFFDHVILARNTSSLGSGGALAVKGEISDPKNVVCIDCEFLENAAYFSGSGIMASGEDALVLRDAVLHNNHPASDFSLAVVSLEDQARFYVQNADWGSSGNANVNSHVAIFLGEVFAEQTLASGEDLWQSFVSGEITAEELQNLLTDFVTEDGLWPGQFDYTGINSVACRYATYTDSCGEIF